MGRGRSRFFNSSGRGWHFLHSGIEFPSWNSWNSHGVSRSKMRILSPGVRNVIFYLTSWRAPISYTSWPDAFYWLEMLLSRHACLQSRDNWAKISRFHLVVVMNTIVLGVHSAGGISWKIIFFKTWKPAKLPKFLRKKNQHARGCYFSEF